MKLQKNDKLVMIGDSITDAGRAQPIGEGLFEALGKGYVAQVDALLGVCYPHLSVRIVNVGTSGHRVRDLKPRWQRDVLDLRPDWVSCMIGTNDVWRQFDSPKQTEVHVPLDEYRETLDELVAQTTPAVKGVILMTPFYIEPNKRDAMRATMDRYGAAVKKVAARRGAVFVDTQAAFDEVLGHYYAATLAWDRVHPTQTGHMVIARAFLNALGFKWSPAR
jgi:lysophospholipase L1-like esterase